MVSAKVMIKNSQGLHARPAGVVAKEASKLSSETFLFHGDKRVQLKSILNIMAAAIKCGTEVEIRCEGEKEEEDLKKLVSVFENEITNL